MKWSDKDNCADASIAKHIMTKQKQKKIELIYAKALAKLLAEQWEVTPSPNEKDWPDLLVVSGTKKFGLEVRELYPDEGDKGSKKKENEAINRKIIQKLSGDYYSNNCIPVKVDLLGDISRYDKILSALIQEAPNMFEMEQKRIQPYSGCIVYIRRLPNCISEYRRWSYVSDSIGWGRIMGEDIIDRAIAIKSKKLVRYQKNVSDVRLVLVSDRTCNSGKDRLVDDFVCNCRGFKKIYYLSYPVEAWCIGS